MKTRIYIDTSVVGGFFDKEFEKETKSLFEQLKKGKVIFVISDLLLRELKTAPEKVRTLLESYPAECFEAITTTKEAKDLANKYISEKVIGQTSFEDCLHIAMATLNKVDILASWNFKHIVNISRIRGYNSVNMKMGYATLEIRNPKDLVEYEND
jgi:predicted nucleic acid-binding protein